MIEAPEMSKNFGIVITSDESVAISGINLVSEKAAQPAIIVAATILAVAFQNSLFRIRFSERRCSIYNKIIIFLLLDILVFITFLNNFLSTNVVKTKPIHIKMFDNRLPA